MSEHRHTLITNTDADRVELHVHTGGSDARWHRFLNCLWDERVIASLSDRAYRVLGAILRLRKDDGTAFASIDTLCALTGYAERSVQAALKELRSHPRRLLAVLGRDVYEVLPGFTFAGRTVVREAVQNPAETRTVLRPACVPLREARARQTNQPKQIEINPEERAQTPEGDSCAGPLAGWPIGLAERRKAQRLAVEGDVHGLLITLGVWAHWAGPLSQSLHATPARILQTAREVLADPDTPANPAYRLGFRLGESLGVPLPKAPSKQKLATAIEHHGLEGLVRIRAERARQEAEARKMSSAEFARTEDE